MERAKLLDQWHNGLRIAHKSHIEAAAQLESRGRWLSIAALVGSTIVGTSLFTDANATLSPRWKIAAGVLSLIVAVLSAVQSSLKLGEQSTLHRTATQRYGALRRELEELLTAEDTSSITSETMASFRKRWDDIDAESPIIPQKIYDSVCLSLQLPGASTIPK